eukprot:2719800-Alexandrium_andersonii.AAC.2
MMRMVYATTDAHVWTACAHMLDAALSRHAVYANTDARVMLLMALAHRGRACYVIIVLRVVQTTLANERTHAGLFWQSGTDTVGHGMYWMSHVTPG